MSVFIAPGAVKSIHIDHVWFVNLVSSLRCNSASVHTVAVLHRAAEEEEEEVLFHHNWSFRFTKIIKKNTTFVKSVI